MKAVALAASLIAFAAPVPAQTVAWTKDDPTDFVLVVTGQVDDDGGFWIVPNMTTTAPDNLWTIEYGGFTLTMQPDPNDYTFEDGPTWIYFNSIGHVGNTPGNFIDPESSTSIVDGDIFLF